MRRDLANNRGEEDALNVFKGHNSPVRLCLYPHFLSNNGFSKTYEPATLKNHNNSYYSKAKSVNKFVKSDKKIPHHRSTKILTDGIQLDCTSPNS